MSARRLPSKAAGGEGEVAPGATAAGSRVIAGVVTVVTAVVVGGPTAGDPEAVDVAGALVSTGTAGAEGLAVAGLVCATASRPDNQTTETVARRVSFVGR